MSKFFIHRPVFAWVLAIIMMIAGGSPSRAADSSVPDNRPAVAISATCPGDAQTVQDTVTCVIEQEWRTASTTWMVVVDHDLPVR